MTKNDPKVKLLGARQVEISGYKGVLVHFRYNVNGLKMIMNHYRVEHPEGKDAFILTTGTLAEEWDQKKQQLASIVSSVELTNDDE